MTENAAQLRAPALEYAAVALLGFMILWPLVSGYAFIHDEYAYCNMASSGGSLSHNLLLIWQDRQYRILDLFAGYLCNPATLDARWTMALQAPALVAIAWGIRDAAKRLAPSIPAVAPVAVLWFALHTATSVALWIPTVGQTWSAAAGIWLGLTVWKALDGLSCGKNPSPSTWVTLAAIGMVGPHLKEAYYGWAGAIAMAIVATWAALPKEDRARSRMSQWSFLVLAVLLPALLHMAARMAWGGLLRTTHADEGRYHAQFGFNLLKNVALSLVGQIAAIPVHYTRRSGSLQWVAYVGILLSAAIAYAGLFGLRRRKTGWTVKNQQVALVAATSLFAMGITWPVQRISELYSMGPNAGMAVVMAIGAVTLWNSEPARVRMAGRIVVFTAFSIGALGLVSRALHFRTSWHDGRALYAQASSFQASLPPFGRVRTVCVSPNLTLGWQHSQYVMPPVNALSPASAENLLNILHPDRQVRIVVQGPSDIACDHFLDGAMLPPGISW